MVRGPIDFEKLEREGIPFASLPAGEKVFLQDETDGAMYLVRSGLIDILMYGEVLETVGAGGVFGEMSLIDDAPRSAAAFAATNSEVAILNKDTFLRLVQSEPGFALYVLQILAQRLRRLGDSLVNRSGDADSG